MLRAPILTLDFEALTKFGGCSNIHINNQIRLEFCECKCTSSGISTFAPKDFPFPIYFSRRVQILKHMDQYFVGSNKGRSAEMRAWTVIEPLNQYYFDSLKQAAPPHDPRNSVRATLRHANHLEREFRLSICEVIEFHSESIFTWNYNWKLLP